MPKPRVFISHSAREDDRASGLLKLLDERLQKERFEVLLDRRSLEVGDAWEHKIATWLDRCHAAIVLFTTKALASDYVKYEVSNLLHRWQRGVGAAGSFGLYPVLVEPLTEPQLRAFYGTIDLWAVQRIGPDADAAIIETLVGKLEPLTRKAAALDDAGERLEGHVARILEKVDDDDFLTDVARKIGIDTKEWPAEKVAPLLADALVTSSMADAWQAVRQLQPRLLDPAFVRNLFDLLMPCWVGPESARALDAVTRSKPGTRCAVVNAQAVRFTPGMYIARAKAQITKLAGAVVPVRTDDLGRNLEAELQARVHQLLEEKLNVNDPLLEFPTTVAEQRGDSADGLLLFTRQRFEVHREASERATQLLVPSDLTSVENGLGLLALGRPTLAWTSSGVQPIGASASVQVVLNHGDNVLSAEFSPDATRIATCGVDGTARVWEVATGQVLSEYKHEAWVRTASFSGDGERLLIASNDGQVRLWAVDGREMLAIPAHRDWVMSAEFSRRGDRVVSASQDHTAAIWLLRGDTMVADRIVQHRAPVNHASFSPDGSLFSTASDDETAGIWNTETGERVATLAHDAEVRSAVWSPDGRWILTADASGNAWLWNAATLERDGPPFHHEHELHFATFSPDGRRIAAASADGNAWLWHVPSRALMSPPFRHAASVPGPARKNPGGRAVRKRRMQGVHSVAFSPDGLRLLTGAADGRALVWNLVGPLRELDREMVEEAVRLLTPTDEPIDEAKFQWSLRGQLLALDEHRLLAWMHSTTDTVAANQPPVYSDAVNSEVAYSEQQELRPAAPQAQQRADQVRVEPRDSDPRLTLVIESGDRGTSLNFAAGPATHRFVPRSPVTPEAIDAVLKELDGGTPVDLVGRKLFEMLIPPEVAFWLDGASRVELILDREAALYPWELLQAPDARVPLALRYPLVRRGTFPPAPSPRASSGPRALLLADLPSGREEARIVADLFGTAGFQVTTLVGTELTDAAVRRALDNPCEVLHITGLGRSDALTDGEPGIVLADRIWSARTFANLRVMPTLTFLNGAWSDLRRAAGFSRALLQAGCRAVIASGLTIDDYASISCADEFYRGVLRGDRFADAMYRARRMLYERDRGGSAWAAYQCHCTLDDRFTIEPVAV